MTDAPAEAMVLVNDEPWPPPVRPGDEPSPADAFVCRWDDESGRVPWEA